jgi:FKBP-type peptidyl-prolyl cis-trans isomerase FkpA
MKNLVKLLKFSVFVFFTIALISGCKETEDPYAGYTLEREQTMIKDWLAQMVINKKDIDTTSTGLFYILETPGTGANVKAGNSVKVKYVGMFLDGSVFDASAYHGDGTMTYIHKDSNTRMIQGWEEGIEIMNKGAKAAFLIPSAKGYGPTGNNTIPKNTPLIFIIEVVEIK